MRCYSMRVYAKLILESIFACERLPGNQETRHPNRTQTAFCACLRKCTQASRNDKLTEHPPMAVHNPRFRQYHVMTISAWVKKA